MTIRASILAVALLAGCAAAPSPPSADLRQALLAEHHRILEAHLHSDVASLMSCDAEDFVLANRGRVTHPTLDERRERFSRYLGSTRFTEYRDAIAPIAKVSADGSLGFVIAQVRAQGVQAAQDGSTSALTFEAAWVELYERRDGAWHCIGNVSSLAPD